MFMTRRAIAFVALLAVASTAVAQLRSAGPVPADLKMSTDELYAADLQRAERYAGGKVKDKQQLREASYQVGKMMAGGRILYGDPVSRLVSRIADTLLKDYPELRKELRFYTVKSPEVNAYATGQGMVFVNAGLVAQVENEAQLAFILSHEIVHYYRNHSLEELVGKKENGKTKRDTDEERSALNEFLRRHNRSREMENEADSLGIAMFYLRSPYAKNVTEGVFDVLQYSALPFDDIPFDTTWFNTPYFQLSGCWLDTVADITSRDNYDDSRSTHPNILSRRHNCASAFEGYYGGEEYVVTSREEFDAVRQLARAECVRQELIHGEYSRAFYNAWLMLRQQPDNEALNQALAQALYGIAMAKNHNGTNSVTGDYQKIEGESQQVYYAMRRMSNEQATLAALHRIWLMHCRFPENEAFARMCEDLMEELHGSLKLSAIDFLATPPAADEQADTVQQEQKALTKYERIKQKRQSQTAKSPNGYALTDLLMADTAFSSRLHEHLSGSWKKAHPDTDDTASVKDTSATIVYSPTYWVVNDKTDELKVGESSRKEVDLMERIAKVGKSFGRRSIDFSDAGLHDMTTDEQYNDFVVLNEWLNEFWQNKGQFDLYRLMQPEMDDLAARYGASTLTVTALLNLENLDPSMSPGYLVLLPLAPVVLYNCFSNIERTSMVTLVVDVRRGKVLSRQSYSYKVADHNALVDAMIYDTYARIGRSSKKEPVGHMGHRFALLGGANLGFAGLQTFDIGKPFAFSPWASLEFAVDRRWSVSAGWSYMKGYDELNNFTRTEAEWDNSLYRYVEHEVLYTDQDYSKNMTTWNLTVRHYSHSDFAPLGPYIAYGAHLVHFTNMSDGSNAGNSFGLHVGAGRNYILFDRLILNFEARYSYTSGLLDLFKVFADGPDPSRLYRCDAIFANMLLLKVGIGVIPF